MDVFIIIIVIIIIIAHVYFPFIKRTAHWRHNDTTMQLNVFIRQRT